MIRAVVSKLNCGHLDGHDHAEDAVADHVAAPERQFRRKKPALLAARIRLRPML
jgi:hypothetical protein